jgi:hypothetical protein
MMQEEMRQGPLVLSEQRYVCYVQLEAAYQDDSEDYAAVRRIEAAYDGPLTVIYMLNSDEMPVKCSLTGEALDRLVAGRLRYLADHGMAVRNPLLEEAFTAYMQACEAQAGRHGVQPPSAFMQLDDFPF